MISFFRYLYAGFYSLSESKGWNINKSNILFYTTSFRLAIYIGAVMVLHVKGIYAINYYNKWIPAIIFAVFEGFFAIYVAGPKKHDMIIEKFNALSSTSKKTYQLLGLVLTPIAISALLIIMTVFRDFFLKANY